MWLAGVSKEEVSTGELCKPVGNPSKSHTAHCLDDKSVRLLEWTEDEFKPCLT